MPEKSKDPFQFWEELKRRKVFRVVAMYAATAFILLELVDIITPALLLPSWTVTLVIVLLAIGFPIAVILSWVFDITPKGVKKTESLEDSEEQELPSASFAKGRFKISDLIIAVLVVVVGILAYPKITGKSKASFNSSDSGKNLIAVLPFMNNTGNSSYDHWEYGISELLISALSSSNELTVIDNQTINEVVNNLENIQTASFGPDIAKEVASKIKVNSYISGNYLLAGSTFRINLKLIDTKSNKVLKTDYIEGKLDSIFSMVGSLASIINNYLEIKIIEEATSFKTGDYATTTSPEAYRYFIKGLEDFWSGEGNAGLLFRDAIQVDTTFTTAYFFLSLAQTKYGDPKSAKESMLKAYEEKDRLPVKMELWLEAFMAQYVRKKPSLSINNFKQVAEIDPFSRLNWLWLGMSYNLIEKYDEAILSFEEIQNLNDQLGPWRNQYYYINFGNAYQKLEKYNKAKNIYKKGSLLFPESADILKEQAICAFLQNDTVVADQYLDQYRSARINQRVFPESLIRGHYAQIYQAAGKIKKAEEMFRLALKMRLSQGPEIDSINPGNNLYWYYATLGSLLIESDINIEEGMEYNQKAIDLSIEVYPDYHPFLLTTKGLGNFKLGKYQEALKYFKMAEERTTLYNHRLHEFILETQKALASQNQ